MTVHATSEQHLPGFNLSPQQRRLWLLQQSEGAPPFTARCAVSIDGRLDVATVERALAEVARRHEILRTRFTVPAGRKLPFQVVTERGAVEFVRHDLSSRDEAGVRAELLRLWRTTATSADPLQKRTNRF